jgi:hypothetical protein
MKYVMSWTDALIFHHDLPFIPLLYTYAPFTSSPQFTSLHFTSLHCASLHFIFDDSPTPSLRLIYHFPSPFPKMTWFTGESPWSICNIITSLSGFRGLNGATAMHHTEAGFENRHHIFKTAVPRRSRPWRIYMPSFCILWEKHGNEKRCSIADELVEIRTGFTVNLSRYVNATLTGSVQVFI